MTEYQTRSEENGLRFFDNALEAFQHAESDTTVWKISFGGVRLVRIDGGWAHKPIVWKVDWRDKT